MVDNNSEQKRLNVQQKLKEYAESLELQTLLLVPGIPDTGKVWYDGQGNNTYNKENVARIEEILIPRLIIAKEAQQFKYIYDKMFSASTLDDTAFDHDVFREEFPQHLDALIERFKSKNRAVQTYPILSAAKKFKNYILFPNDVNLTTTETTHIKEQELPPATFTDIFTKPEEIDKYVNALMQTSPPLLSKEREFIGKPRRHKGVIGSWIFDLRNLSIIKQSIKRQDLAKVLNNEIKNFNMGNDGKTISNTSNLYDRNFKSQLFKLTNISQ